VAERKPPEQLKPKEGAPLGFSAPSNAWGILEIIMSKKYMFFRRDGAKSPYWVYNPDGKTTIVAIHGFRGTHHGLEKLAGELRGFRLIIPDLPGFGESPAFKNTHDLESYTDFVGEFLRNLDLKTPPILLGHSFGSIVCSHFAAQHPTAIASLILINPIGAPALEGPRALLTKLAVAYYLLGRKLPKKAAHTWLSASPIVDIMSLTMTRSKDKTLRDFIHQQHRQHFSTFASPQVVSEAFKTSVQHTVLEIADELTPPTLLIVGEADDITPLAKQRNLHTKIKNSQLAVINDVGHLIHYEKAAEAAKAIRVFARQAR
jgi:pimeloyl-ACP methyl ester carboxylesterase